MLFISHPAFFSLTTSSLCVCVHAGTRARVCAFSYDVERLTLPKAMSACCCVGGITEGWGGVCHIHRTGRAQ